MANYALVFIGTISPPVSGDGFIVQSFIDARSGATIFPQFQINTSIDQTDSPSEINRKVLDSARTEILTTCGIDVPIRNLTLFASAT